MTHYEFIRLMNKRIKEGKFISKILYDDETSKKFKIDFPRDNILYIQTDTYYAWEHIKPMITVLLDNRCILSKEWEISGIGIAKAIDIVDPSIEDYISLSLLLKNRRIGYNKKTNKIYRI